MTAGIKVSTDDLRTRFMKSNALLIGIYVNANTKTLFRCLVHNVDSMVFPSNLFRGQRLGCCGKEASFLAMDEVVRRLSLKGYDLVGGYSGTRSGMKIDVRCRKHGEVHSVRANGILFNKYLPCCGQESISKKMTGRPISDETKLKCRDVQNGDKAYWWGRTLSSLHKDRISEGGIRHFNSVDGHITHASKGVTAGRRGSFYIFRVGSYLKFGSVAKMTVRQRFANIRRHTSQPCSIVLSAVVADAGAYEAAMMLAHREHWSHGEFFHDFLLGTEA